MRFSVNGRQYLRALVISTVLAIQPLMPATAAETPPLNYEPLVKQYIQQNREAFLADKNLNLAYANRFLCDEFQKERNNEFNFPKVLAKAQEQVKLLNEPPTSYTIRTIASFGTYDTTAGKFAFTPIDAQHNVFTISDPKGANGQMYALTPCAPQVPGFPQRFNVVVENYDLIDGLPMPEDQAKALLESRAKRGGDQRKVGVNIIVTLKDWQKADDKNTASVTAEITNVTLDDGTEQNAFGTAAAPKPIYAYDAAYIAARKAIVDQRVAADKLEKATGPIELNPENVNAWYQALANGKPKTMKDGTELRPFKMPERSYDNTVSVLENGVYVKKTGMYINTLNKDMQLSMPITGSASIKIKFVNSEEFFPFVPLSPEQFAKYKENLGSARATMIATPVGADQNLNLYLHVDKVMFEYGIPGQPKGREEVASKTAAEPYTPPAPGAAAAPAAAPAATRGSVDFFR